MARRYAMWEAASPGSLGRSSGHGWENPIGLRDPSLHAQTGGTVFLLVLGEELWKKFLPEARGRI